jgi:hypothetical protein
MGTLAQMYAKGTAVPPRDIPKLIKAFDRLNVPGSDYRYTIVMQAIAALNKQAEEAKQKEKEKKEG